MLRVVAGCLAGGTFLALAALWWARRWPGFGVRKRTRSRPPRGVDPALALLIRTGLSGPGLIEAPMVVLAELVHRRVIYAAADGEGSWRLKYTDRTATLTGYEKLLVNALFGGNSRTTLNLDTLRSIAPAIARELRNNARKRGWDRPPHRPAWPEHYEIVPGLMWVGGLTTFFALAIGGHRWPFGYEGWGVTALSFWFAALSIAAVRSDVGERRRRPDRRRGVQLGRFLRYLQINADAASRDDPAAAKVAARYTPYLLVAGDRRGEQRATTAGRRTHKVNRADNDAEPDQNRIIAEMMEDQERLERLEPYEDALVDYFQDELERRLESPSSHRQSASDQHGDDGHHHDDGSHHDGGQDHDGGHDHDDGHHDHGYDW